MIRKEFGLLMMNRISEYTSPRTALRYNINLMTAACEAVSDSANSLMFGSIDDTFILNYFLFCFKP